MTQRSFCRFLVPSVALMATAFLLTPFVQAQSSSAQLLVTGPVVETQMVSLAGNVRHEANVVNDRGAVNDDLKLEHILLQLKRPADREEALTQKIDGLYRPGSSDFHRWLTAEEVGELFGPNQKDIAFLCHFFGTTKTIR